MSPMSYLDAIVPRLADLYDQREAINRAVQVCADVIASDGVVHVFGAGHSRMACEEAYPRIGGVLGFRPVVELAVTNFHSVVGENGLRQAIFLERVPDYGKLIFESLDARPNDAVIVFSSSGVEAIILDFVDAAQIAGLPAIGVTSFEYSQAASSERGGTRRLADVADVAIDNHVPIGDAMVSIDGLRERVGPSASIMSLAVMDSIAVGVAETLVEKGLPPLVFASPHLIGRDESSEQLDRCLDEYRARVVGRRR